MLKPGFVNVAVSRPFIQLDVESIVPQCAILMVRLQGSLEHKGLRRDEFLIGKSEQDDTAIVLKRDERETKLHGSTPVPPATFWIIRRLITEGW
jgi:hypothetical protein